MIPNKRNNMKATIDKKGEEQKEGTKQNEETNQNEDNEFQADDQEEEKIRYDNQLDPSDYSRKKFKKRKPRYTEMMSIVHTFEEIKKKGNARKIGFFKSRRVDAAAYKYKIYKHHRPSAKKKIKKEENLRSAELEMATITSLREMYFKKPKILNEIEKLGIGKETNAETLPDVQPAMPKHRHRVFRRYLRKYKQLRPKDLKKKALKEVPRQETYAASKKSRDEIRNGYIVSVFNIDDDNLFTDKELMKIHKMKKNMCAYSNKDEGHQGKSKLSKEVWEWSEFVNNIPNLSAPKGDSMSSCAIEESDKEPIAKPETELRMKNCLVNWFQRESPPTDIQDPLHKFNFHEPRYPKKYLFQNENSRMDAAIQFLKFGKIVYPDLDCLKVLAMLQDYIGTLNVDSLQERACKIVSPVKIPNKRLRYFRKLLNEAKELETIFADPEVKFKGKDDSKEHYIAPGKTKAQEEALKSTLYNYHLGYIYDQYVESCLPSPFNEIFISIANGLMKYNIYVSSDPESKAYKNEMANLVEKIMQLMLDSMKWVIETIFRSRLPFDIIEEGETLKPLATDDIEEDQVTETKPIEGQDPIVKKLMVYIIKFTNLNYLFNKHDPDISSSECQSLSCLSIDDERK